MKKLLVLLFSGAILSSGFAADWATSKGSAYGKGNMYASPVMSVLHFGGYGLFEYGIHDAISIGGGIGYNGYNFSSAWRYNYVPILARGSFHPFNIAAWADKISIRSKLDPYVGISTGWGIGWSSYRHSGTSIDEPSVGGFIFRENIGVRFYPKENFYLIAEEGGGFGLFNFGVGFKF